MRENAAPGSRLQRGGMTAIEIHGYAIVSCDDRIADASGATPEALRREADWAYFQAELDRAALTVLGRLGHAVNPNPKARLGWWSPHRCGLVRRLDGWWWIPPAYLGGSRRQGAARRRDRGRPGRAAGVRSLSRPRLRCLPSDAGRGRLDRRRRRAVFRLPGGRERGGGAGQARPRSRGTADHRRARSGQPHAMAALSRAAGINVRRSASTVAIALTACLGAPVLAQTSTSTGSPSSSPAGSASPSSSTAPATGGATILTPRTGQNAGSQNTDNQDADRSTEGQRSTARNPNALTPPFRHRLRGIVGGRATARGGTAGRAQRQVAGLPAARRGSPRKPRLARRSCNAGARINRLVMQSICNGC